MNDMLYESENRDLTLALTGDAIVTRQLSPYREERFLKLRDLIKQADVRFTNFESCSRKLGEGVPTLSVGTFMTTEPSLLEELKWYGFNIVSASNNHVFDWGEEGVLLTMRYLEEAGIPYSGIGRNLREAVRPVYLDTPNGRVALISANSFFGEWSRATNQRVDASGKPGLNAIGYKTSYVVDRESFEALHKLGGALGFDLERKRLADFGFYSASEVGGGSETVYDFLGTNFHLGDSVEVHSAANERDVAENLRQVREARRQADWVIFSHHNHLQGGKTLFTAAKRTEIEGPAEFMVDFAHRCIDEGVDVFVGHGPHIPLGIEIYKGKPIFYSLGHFIMQNDNIQVLPGHAYDRFGIDPMATPTDFLDARSGGDRRSFQGDPLYWETLAVGCRFEGGKLEEVSIYPVDLGFGLPRSQRGRPVLADEELGCKVIARMARISEEFGTSIEYAGGRGVVTGL